MDDLQIYNSGHRTVCSICNYVPGRSRSLDDHKCEDYLGKRTDDNVLFSCPECPYRAKTKANVRIHRYD